MAATSFQGIVTFESEVSLTLPGVGTNSPGHGGGSRSRGPVFVHVPLTGIVPIRLGTRYDGI